MRKSEFLKDAIKLVAPGTEFRQGIENILNARTGALLVLMTEDDIKTWESIVQPGFFVNCEYTPQRLYELVKMDGAVIVNPEVNRILYANVQLAPDGSIQTFETGMRHRAAERVSKQTDRLCVAISRRRSVVTLFWGPYRYVLNDLNLLIIKVNQALNAIEKYRYSFNRWLGDLDILEIERRVTLVDVLRPMEKAIRALKMSSEIEPFLWELGIDGRLAKIQLEELIENLQESVEMLIMDYFHDEKPVEEIECHEVFDRIMQLSEKDLRDHGKIITILGFSSVGSVFEQPVIPKGFRMLRNIPKIPMSIAYNVVHTYHNLNEMAQSNSKAFQSVEGIGEKRAKAIVEGLESLRLKANIMRILPSSATDQPCEKG